ncbi:unnamed protein product, partial [Prorocentrum cordatum]
ACMSNEAVAAQTEALRLDVESLQRDFQEAQLVLANGCRERDEAQKAQVRMQALPRGRDPHLHGCDWAKTQRSSSLCTVWNFGRGAAQGAGIQRTPPLLEVRRRVLRRQQTPPLLVLRIAS